MALNTRSRCKNLADYAVFSNWKVTFRLGSQTVTIDQNNHTAEISGDDLKELIVTAAAGITNGIQPASVTDTIPDRHAEVQAGRQY